MPKPSGKKRQLIGAQELYSFFFGKKPRGSWKMTEDHIQSVVFVRRARDAVFGENLFSDPAWDILLELYAVVLGGRTMSLIELAQATEAPLSTVRRWVLELERRGLTATKADPHEPARVTVTLTADGISKMEHLADHWGSAFRAI